MHAATTSGIAERACETQPTSAAPAVQVRTCILVAGMHRSGTSATARVVNLLGADIAGNLVAGIPGDNDRGFWESHATYRLHDRLFAALNSAWDDPYPLPDGWWKTDAAREAKRALETRLRDAVRAQTIANQEISRMRGCRSWRVTAPLRAFRRLGKSIRWRR